MKNLKTHRQWMLALLATLAFSHHAQAEITYRFTSPTYSSTTPCGATPGCIDLPAGGRVDGWFTTATPLPANATMAGSTVLHRQVMGWSFSNGASTITSATPGARLHQVRLDTDATGRITASLILVSRWVDGGAGPHAVGDLLDLIGAATTAPFNNAILQARCGSAPSMSQAEVADSCPGHGASPVISSASYSAPGGIWVLDAPIAAVTSPSIVEGNAGTRVLTFTVTPSRASTSGPMQLNWHTADGTASAGSDYTAASGTLVWAQGDATPEDIAITIHGDTTPEPHETFSVVLDGFVGMAGGSASTGLGTIRNDDGPAPGGAQPVPSLADGALLALSALLIGTARAALRRRSDRG